MAGVPDVPWRPTTIPTGERATEPYNPAGSATKYYSLAL